MAKKEEKITIQGKDLIKELGLEDLPVEKQEKLINRMSDLIYRRILLRMVDQLTEKETNQLNNLLDKGDLEEIDKYVKDKIPDFVSIWKEEIERFQNEMIRGVKKRTA